MLAFEQNLFSEIAELLSGSTCESLRSAVGARSGPFFLQMHSALRRAGLSRVYARPCNPRGFSSCTTRMDMAPLQPNSVAKETQDVNSMDRLLKTVSEQTDVLNDVEY